jgi:hypothetical protein
VHVRAGAAGLAAVDLESAKAMAAECCTKHGNLVVRSIFSLSGVSRDVFPGYLHSISLSEFALKVLLHGSTCRAISYF